MSSYWQEVQDLLSSDLIASGFWFHFSETLVIPMSIKIDNVSEEETRKSENQEWESPVDSVMPHTLTYQNRALSSFSKEMFFIC